MKLVELLAKEVQEWHEDTERLHQDANGRVFATRGREPKYKKEWGEWDISHFEVIMNGDDPFYGNPIDISSDYQRSFVTESQWQAERDRKKGGEWIRNRGRSDKPKVDANVLAEVRFRDGTTAENKNFPRWIHNGSDKDIMQYRIISQPQAEEVEVNKFCTGEKCSATAENIAHSQQCQLEHEMAYTGFKIDQIDGPIKWRDTIIHCQAIIEDCEREIQRNENLLALEGFALIPAMTPVMGVADIIFPIEEWQIGDVVEVTSVSCESAAPLGVFEITDIDSTEPKYELDDSYFPNHNQMKFIRRP
jgi:hypothetical protein